MSTLPLKIAISLKVHPQQLRYFLNSTLTIVGNVEFYKNKGIQGGALMLIGTIMQIARKVKLLFRDNNAEKTGGAIFVVHPQSTINTHGYYHEYITRSVQHTQ